MDLNQFDRGMLETFIDNMVKQATEEVKLYRIPKLKSDLQIQREEDFVFGMIYGKIWQYFINCYTQVHPLTLPTQEEMDDVFGIVFRRIKEVKEAIFKAG